MALYFLCSVVLWPIIVWISPWQGVEALSPGIYLPQHDSHNFHVVAQKNGKLLLNCSVSTNASAFGRPEVSWFKDGQEIQFDSRLQLVQNGSLYFKRVLYRKKKNITDAGIYECHVKNNIGSIIARRVNLKIASIHKSYIKEPTPQTVAEGGVARFQCRIKAEPPPLYTWLKDEKEQITANNRFIIISSGILQILNVNKDDEGSYSCTSTPGGLHNLPDQVDNIKWYPSSQARLTVVQSVGFREPKIIAPPQDTVVELGQMTVLECLVDGHPKPNVTWERQSGKRITSRSNIIGGNLKLLETTENDADIYICKVSSPGRPDIIRDAKVTIHTRPILIKSLDSAEHPASRLARFRCTVDGVPKPEISWYKDAQPIEKTKTKYKISKEDLIVMDSVPGDSGYYQCIAGNVVDYATGIARLSIKVTAERPGAPRNVQVFVQSSHEVIVSWSSAKALPCCPVLAYAVYIQETDNSGTDSMNFVVQGGNTKIISKLKPYTNYSVYIRAFIKQGGSKKSAVVTVQTQEAAPDVAPIIRLASTTPSSILIEWDELPVKERNGVIIGYKIYYMKEGFKSMKIADEKKSSARSHLLTGLEPATTYKVRVLAGTKAGFPHFDDKKWPWVHFTTPGKGKPLLNLTVPDTPANLQIIPISVTSVNVTWNHNTESNPILGYTLVYKMLGANVSAEHSHIVQIADPLQTSYTVNNLVEEAYYEFSVVANNEHGSSGPMVEEYLTSKDPLPPSPRTVHVINRTSTTLFVTWVQPNSSVSIAQFEIRYYPWIYNSKEPLPGFMQMFGDKVGVEITSLKPYTYYQLDVRSLSSAGSGRWSKWSTPIVEHTLEDLPSEPRDVKAFSTGNGVEIRWKPPAQPNGNITTYILEYQIMVKSKNSDTWKILRVNGSSTSLKLDEKVSGKLTLRLKACTSVGPGPFSAELEIKDVDVAGTTVVSKSPWEDQRLGIIVGVAIGILCIIICIVIIMLRNRCVSNSYPSTQRAYYHGNGHVPRRGNGHIMNGETANTFQLETIAPMLTRDGENEHSDSKGCGSGNLIVTPNGTRVNGYVPFKNGMKNGHISNSHLSNVIYRDPAFPEETHGLIAAMLASSDGSHTSDEQQMSMKTPDRDSLLDGIDRSLESSLEEVGEEVSNPQLPLGHHNVTSGIQKEHGPPNLNTSQPYNSVPKQDFSKSAHYKAARDSIGHDRSFNQEVVGGSIVTPTPELRMTYSSCSNQLSTSCNGHPSDDASYHKRARMSSPSHLNTKEKLKDKPIPQELYKPSKVEASSLQHGNLSEKMNDVKSNGLSNKQQNLSHTNQLGSSCHPQGLPNVSYQETSQAQPLAYNTVCG